ncbi:MAG TPA: ion channel [Thermodesulfovibrionales bacterium]|nr:ion channel [Thermodesulfovibrionales bacterium]
MTINKFSVPAKFWSEDRNLKWLLVALVLDMFILDPLVSVFTRGLALTVINSLAFAVVLFLGLLTLTRHKVIQIIFAGITVIIISVRFGYFIFREDWLLVWDILLSMASLIAFVIVLLIYVYQEGPVTRHRIGGAIAAYLLIALACAFGYLLIELLIPGAFHFPDSAPRITDMRFVRTFYYFSVSTLTTVGYGDVTPVHPFARNLAMMEALIGQLYPATLIARLVTLHIATGRTNKDR